MDLTPQIIRNRAYAARVSINQVLKKAGIAPSTFYRWERKSPTVPADLTLAKIDDALAALEAERTT